jgi:hypothetical protein
VVVELTLPFDGFYNSPRQQRDHDLVVSRDFVALSAPLSRPLYDVYARTVVPLHIEIARREAGRFSRVEISRDRQSFEKHFRHYHRAAEVEDDTAIMQRGQRRGETAEIAVARVTDRRAARGRMLVDYLSADRRVNRAGNSQPLSGEKHGQLTVR